ncbi:hypothetical protein GE21DRAFT_1221416, partial [Neurospora crassa]
QFIDYKLYLYRIFVTRYINNIIVFSNITEDYLKYLEIIFKLFKDINLNIVLKKSFVAYLFIQLLSYYIDGLSIATTTDRITIIRNI